MSGFSVGIEQFVNAVANQTASAATNQTGGDLTFQAILTLIITSAGVLVTYITYFFQSKQLKSRTVLEVFKDFNLPSHREARRIIYGEEMESAASYDLLGLKPSTPTEAVTSYRGELKRVSENIVRGDLNNAATLIRHGLMDDSVFLDEYWWIIIRVWDISKDEIYQRRANGTGAMSYMQNFQDLNSKAEEYAKKYHKTEFEEYVRKYRSTN